MKNKFFLKIANEASKLLNDSYDCDQEYNFTRWSENELIHYAQDAVNMIYLLYPKKFTEVVTVTLQKGKIQQLPDKCSKITKVLGVDQNGRASSSIASAVNGRLGELFPSGCLESSDPNSYEIESYDLEDTSDKVFYVYPPVPADGIEANIICIVAPDVNDLRYEPAVWMHNPIIEWVLYRAYSSEDESAQSANQSEYHLKHFYSILENYMKSSEYLMETSMSQRVRTNEPS